MTKNFILLSLLSVTSLTACQTLPTHTRPTAISAQPAIFIPTTPTLNDLQNYDWQLIRANSNNQPIISLQTLADKGQIKLSFSQNRMHYTVGCNQLSTNFSLSKNLLLIQGNTATTLMACGELQPAENLLAEKMQGTSKLTLDGNSGAVLDQTTSDNTHFVWQGKLKPSVKYGKGETLFLEVKPTTKPCNKLTDKQCLEVRDIVYIAEGIKTTTGQWRLLSQPIQGFKLTPNTQQIIRVNRYRTLPKDTMGYANVYVFDGMVESQLLIP